MGRKQESSESAKARWYLIRVRGACIRGSVLPVFPNCVDDQTAEVRWHAIGSARIEPAGSAVLLVVHAYREDDHGEEIIRIISARAAEKYDIRRYQEQKVD
jgi:uncharacterized DUF497 family protein